MKKLVITMMAVLFAISANAQSYNVGTSNTTTDYLGTGQQLIVISMVIGQVHQLLRLIILEIPQLLTGTVMAIP